MTNRFTLFILYDDDDDDDVQMTNNLGLLIYVQNSEH